MKARIRLSFQFYNKTFFNLKLKASVEKNIVVNIVHSHLRFLFTLRQMENFARIILLLVRLFLATMIVIKVNAGPDVFNVLDYGAAADGITNDTMSFVETWNNACSAETINATMIIPQEKTFLVHVITFSGPCKPADKINILLLGRLVAPDSPDAWSGRDKGRWLIFKRVNGLQIIGTWGVVDGRGKGWWDISCKLHPNLPGCVKLAPTALSFIDSSFVYISNITFLNSPQTHILLSNCNNTNLELLNIDSPEFSPNTDGIHLDKSHEVSIDNTKISCGDDCVSLGDYSSNISISKVSCGPGHGISIGSLGRSGNEVQVYNITVQDVHFNGTTNGARIKTWQTGRGSVQDITFKRMNFTDVKNPIVIDQHYWDIRGTCKPTETGVQLKAVHFLEASGTSRTKIGINLNCSEVVPCTDIMLDSIQLSSSNAGEKLLSFCNNAYGYATEVLEPKPCIISPN